MSGQRTSGGRHEEDLDLVARMLAGQKGAYETFADRYPRALYRFAITRLDGDRELTREAVQNAMTKALARLDSYRGEASLLTWLCSCCRNEILMLFRARRSAPMQVELAEEMRPAVGAGPAPPADPEATLLARETTHLVHMALDLLPAHYSQALEWKYIDRLSVREIAERLDLRPKAAESLLTRARQTFRKRYRTISSETESLTDAWPAEGSSS